MTIASQTSRISYTGNGSVATFAVPFFFAANSHLIVYRNSALQLLGTHYGLSGAGVSAGGTCTFVTAPSDGDTILIYRDPPVTQTTSYNNADPFPAKSHENALDKLTTLIQRLVERFHHVLSLGETSTITDVSVADPVAGEYLKYNAGGTGIESTSIITPAGTYAIATQSEAEAGVLNTVLMTALRVKQAIVALTRTSTAALSETGVVDYGYPVGDVRRYGVKNDGMLLTGTFTNTSPVISGISDTSNVVVGMKAFHADLTGTHGVVLSKTSTSITLDCNATASGSRTFPIGTDSFADNTITAAIAANGKNPAIQLYFPPGYYTTGINMDATWTGTEHAPWRANFDHAKIGGILHITGGCSWVKWTGTVYTYDRFGITAEGSAHIFVENVHGLHDTQRNVASPGSGNRGFHFVEVNDFHFNDMTLEDCEPTSAPGNVLTGSLAGFAFEQDSVGVGVYGHMLWVKNSHTHGVFVNGQGWNVDLIRVDASVPTGIDYNTGGGLTDYVSETESEKGFGVGMNRWGGRIGRIEVRQDTASPSGNYLSAIMFGETGRTVPTDATYNVARIDSVYVEVGAATASLGANVKFGVLSVTPRMSYDIGSMTVKLPSGYALLNATDPLVHFPALAANAFCNVHIGHLRFINPQGYQCVLGGTASGENKNITIDETEVIGFANPGGVYQMVGHASGTLAVNLGPVQFDYSGGAYATRAMLHFDICEQLNIEGTRATVTTPAGNGVQLLRIQASKDINVVGLRAKGFRGVSPVGAISLNANAKLNFTSVECQGDDSASSAGIYFDSGSHVNYTFTSTYMTDYALGTKDNGGTYTSMAVQHSASLSCGAVSDLDTGDTASKVNQTLVTA